jgi:hypothetical protein
MLEMVGVLDHVIPSALLINVELSAIANNCSPVQVTSLSKATFFCPTLFVDIRKRMDEKVWVMKSKKSNQGKQ